MSASASVGSLQSHLPWSSPCPLPPPAAPPLPLVAAAASCRLASARTRDTARSGSVNLATDEQEKQQHKQGAGRSLTCASLLGAALACSFCCALRGDASLAASSSCPSLGGVAFGRPLRRSPDGATLATSASSFCPHKRGEDSGAYDLPNHLQSLRKEHVRPTAASALRPRGFFAGLDDLPFAASCRSEMRVREAPPTGLGT